MKENGSTISYCNEQARVEHENEEFSRIFAQLQKTRDEIVASQDIDPESGKYTYNPMFNIIVYKELQAFENPFSRAYSRVRDTLQASTRYDLCTMLGERYHVGVSRYKYYWKEGRLVTQDGTPLIEMMKRGRDFRREFGNSIDWDREDAEVAGAQQLELDVADENVPLGSVRASISLPGQKGSIYKMNFYDLFTKTDYGFEVRRYTSALTAEEYIQRLHELNSRITKTYIPTAEEFLRSPLRFELIMPEKTADNIHAFFHKEHTFMKEEDFAEILDVCTPLIDKFVQTLSKNPYDTEAILLLYNTILNTADRVERNINRRNKGELYELFTRENTKLFTDEDILHFGMIAPEQRMSGCGINAGFSMIRGMIVGTSLSLVGAQNLQDFAHMTDDKGPLAFVCPNIACGKINIRPHGQLLERCLHCLADVSCGNNENTHKEEEKKKPIDLFDRKKKDTVKAA